MYKVRLSKCDNESGVLHHNLLFLLLIGQQNKPELDQEKSLMEQEDTLYKVSLAHTEHDVISDDEVSSTPWDGNAVDGISNVPIGSVTYSKS